MKICLIDNKIDDYSSYKTIVDELISDSGFPDNIEFRKEFFPGLENGLDDKVIKSLLEEYDAIMYHSSEYSGLMDHFSMINETANNPSCKLIGFSGEFYDPVEESDYSIIVDRDVFYPNLKECIKNAMKSGEIDLNIFLNFRF